MDFILTALRWSLLTAAAMTGVIGAYHGVPALVEEDGAGAGNLALAAGFVVTLIAALLGGALYLLQGRQRHFRVHAGAALLLFGLSLLTVQGNGVYFLTAGALSVLSLCVLATKRPDSAQRYAWLGAVVRSRRKAA